MPFVFFFTPVLVAFIAGQIYWISRARAWGRRLIQTKKTRTRLAVAALAVYVFFFAFNISSARTATPTHLTLSEALLVAPFLWWIFSSTVAFLLVILLWLVKSVAAAAVWLGRMLFFAHDRQADPPLASPARRQFLRRTAAVVTGTPFVAGAYGLLYGRLNLETTERRIRLARLPKAFEGFRIAQLSDIHIGPFMPAEEIRKYVGIANALKADLIVLTGDFITWDAGTQEAVVNVLAGLRAPFGIFGCLGNHERWSNAEDSITRLFQQVEIRMLRRARVAIPAGGERINLMGVDFETVPRADGFVPRNLIGVDRLMAPDTANILLSHNPATFDRAAELGIDLSLAGHTHGGQVALEFVSPEIAPSRLVTPYVSGWFQKHGAQLYVNRGIGTIAAPMRIGAPPEITVYELTGARS